MERQIVRLTILQTGKLMAVMYAILALIMLPFMLLGAFAGAPGPGGFPILIFLILYPIMGFIGGIFMAILYNISAKLVGGLEVEVDSGEYEIEKPAANHFAEIPEEERKPWRG